MRIELRGRAGIRSQAVRGYTERRLRFALGRFATRIERLTARVADVNGPRGGVDKTCQVVATLASGGEVRIEERDCDLYVAVDRASERLGRCLAREIERRRELLLPRADHALHEPPAGNLPRRAPVSRGGRRAARR